jgi:hypothetical protein
MFLISYKFKGKIRDNNNEQLNVLSYNFEHLLYRFRIDSGCTVNVTDYFLNI